MKRFLFHTVGVLLLVGGLFLTAAGIMGAFDIQDVHKNGTRVEANIVSVEKDSAGRGPTQYIPTISFKKDNKIV